MKKIFIFLVLSAVFLAGCGASELSEKHNASPDSKKEAESSNGKKLLRISKDDINLKYSPSFKGNLKIESLKEWLPASFTGKNQATKKWSHKLTSHSARNKTPTASLPIGWLVNYGIASDGNDFYHKLINPENGELMDLQEENCGGPTNGEYVFGYSQIPAGQAVCWNLDDKKVVWRGLIGYQNNKVCITNNTIISVVSDNKSFVLRGNPETGETIWALESDYKITDSCIAGTKIVIILDERELYSIAIENGVFKNIATAKDPLSVASFDSTNAWILTRNGIVQEIDIDKNIIGREIVLSDKEKGIKGQLSGMFSKIEKIGNSLLLKISNGDRTNYLIMDSISGNIKEQFFGKVIDENVGRTTFRAKVINGSLIFEDEKQLRGIDPDTLEITWWIDLDENMKNAHVELLDWRGVLVVSDNEIACFDAIR